MVKKSNKDTHQDDVNITTEDIEITEPELEDVEEKQDSFNNTLRDKLKVCEAEKKEILEESQRAKADFLNARKRLEEEKKREKERVTIKHIEELIPLCDSFHVAMSNKEVWEKADENWRKGIEGINSQLQRILTNNKVSVIDPVGEEFNPHEHEALSTVSVPEEQNHKVITVIQLGYVVKRDDDTSELIRPARVIIGNHEKN